MAKTFVTIDSEGNEKIITYSPLADVGVGVDGPSPRKTGSVEVPGEASTTPYESIPEDIVPEGARTALMAELQDAAQRILGGKTQASSTSYGVTLPPATPVANPTVPANFAPPSAPAPQVAERQAGSSTILLSQAGVGLVGFSPQEVQALATLGRPKLAGAS